MEIVVLITGSGAPGIKGTLYSLKNNFDGRKIRTIGTDTKGYVVGKYLCDNFYKVPNPSEDSFIPELLKICEKEEVDVVLPQTTDELFKLAESSKEFKKINTKVAISSKSAIELSNNKHELMKISKKLGLPTAKFHLVNNSSDLEKYAGELGWPSKPVVVKPPVSSGMRGLRIIDEKFDRKNSFYSEKPTDVYLKLDEFKEIVGEKFPELLLMEFLPGKEYSVDILKANTTTIVPRSRDLIRTGITFNGTVEKNEQIIDTSAKLSEKIGLKYAFGFQFKLDENGTPKIIECNPRIQGTMVLSTLAGANIIYGAVKHALGEDVPDFEIKWGTRLLRYWGGIGVYNSSTEEII